MDTNLIYQFKAVFESGTIAKAAEQLNMTPGALSRAIKRLEEEFKCQLFVPSGRNIIPTEKANIFYLSSQEIIRSIENTKNNLKNIQSEVKSMRISTFEVFSTHFIAWMADELKFTFPMIVTEHTPGDIEKAILSGAVDFGLTYIPELNSELDHIPISDMPIGVFKSVRCKNDRLPYAIPITELGINHLQAKSLDGWPADTYRDVQFKFEMLETAFDLASRGSCKILCPKFIVGIENERLGANYKLTEENQKIKFPKFKVYAIKKKSQPEDEYFKKICKAVRIVLNK